MKLDTFRARYFNPEKWVVTGLAWAVLTTLLLAGWDLLRTGRVDSKIWTFGAVAVVFGGPVFGLLFRFISRKALHRAR